MKLKALTLAIALALGSTAYAQTQALNYEAKEISTVLTVGGVTNAWARGITGKGVTIAILDNGFDLMHSDLAGKVVASKNFNSTIAYNNPKDPTAVTWGWHGTLMTGIAAGANNGAGTVGVAPDARLLLGQVGQGGTMTSIEMAAVYKGIDWASALGATVINLSLGSNFDTNFQKQIALLNPGVTGIWQAPTAYGSMYGYSMKEVNAFAVGTNRGSIIVASAGNQALPYAQFPGAFATQVDSTGKLVLGGRMLIVGATDATGTRIAPFSNQAGHICTNISGTTCNDPYQVKDFYVVAPGMQVYGSHANQLNMGTNGATAVQGTSPAAAYVSGGIALMKQAWPQLRPEQLVAITLKTAKDLTYNPVTKKNDLIGVDSVYGHGLVDFDAATRPMGALVLANNTKLTGSGPQGKVLQLQGTGVVTTGATSLSTSSVLQNSQAVDTIGRNYTVDLTKAVGYNNALSYQYGTPWMALAGHNYKHFVTPVGKDGVLTLMSSDGGSSSQYEWQHSADTRLNFEVGALSERNGFLGTQGGGAMAFGGSNTVWAGAGFSQTIVGNTALIGNYTMGITRTGNVQDSMVQLGSTVVADSWKLGVAQSNLLFEGKSKDTLSLSVASPVAVRKGYATITGVTGYTYTDNADGTTDANPVIQLERVSLAPKAREMNLVLGYTVAVKNTTSVGVNLVRQFNAGGQAGVQATGVSIMARSVF
jgi:subtilisin family serine protease